jgi:hypothetical protein
MSFTSRSPSAPAFTVVKRGGRQPYGASDRITAPPDAVRQRRQTDAIGFCEPTPRRLVPAREYASPSLQRVLLQFAPRLPGCQGGLPHLKTKVPVPSRTAPRRGEVGGGTRRGMLHRGAAHPGRSNSPLTPP